MQFPKTAKNAILDGFDERLFDNLTWMTTREAAFYLRVSEAQVRNMVWRGQLKSYHLHNKLRFLKSDLDQLLTPAFDKRRLYGNQAV
jgi:excisionase family DNA binding protein